MKKNIFAVLLFLIVNIAYAQDVTHNISQKEAAVLLRSISQQNADNIKVDPLLRLALYNILKAGENKADLDSATLFINKAKTINQKIKSPGTYGYIALAESMLQRESGKIKEGKINAEAAVANLKNTKDKYHLGLAYLELAQYYDYTNPAQLNDKTRLGEEAVRVLAQSNATELKAFAYKSLADLYSTQADYPKALQNIKHSLEAYQSIHYKQLQGVYIIYSGLYGLTGDFKNALKYGLEALKTARNVKDTTMQLCEINNVVAVILGKLREREKAISYYKEALKVAEKYNDHPSVILVTSNIASTYRSLGKYNEGLQFLKSVHPKYLETNNAAYIALIPNIYCNLYTALRSYSRAKPYADQLLKILSQHANDIADLNNVYDVLIGYFIFTKQYGPARLYLDKSQAFINKMSVRSPALISRLYGRLFQLDSAMGNYKSALNYHVKYARVRDSIFNETKSKQLKQLEVQYETENKIAEIKILNQRNELLNKSNELQQSKLQQAQITRNWSAAGICLVLIIAGLLYRQNTIKQKNNSIVTRKNELLQHLLSEKEWLLKEVHHRVKNNLHTVICLLESQARYLDNDALQAIETSQQRIFAMSLIHQKLYQSDDIKTINMASYIPELVQSLIDGFGTAGQIHFNLNIEPINLSLSHAIPLALIINEAVTNSIKYAFPDNSKGEILIVMKDEGERIILELADNGIGMPQIDNDIEPESLGLRLIKGLSEDIDAEVRFEVAGGTKITINFELDPLNNPKNLLSAANMQEVSYD